nr:putative zinc finger, CCHC-type [Tanacetum cinerariifolium]
MTSLGSTLDESTRVRKLLNSVPERFIQIVASIEQYSDLDKMTLDEAIGRLKTFEERIKVKKGRAFEDHNTTIMVEDITMIIKEEEDTFHHIAEIIDSMEKKEISHKIIMKQ